MELVLRRIEKEVYVPDCAPYIAAVEDILHTPLFHTLADYPHHGNTSCLAHSIAVSYLSWKCCKNLGLREIPAARGGLLHDFFLYDWHSHYAKTGRFFHGFSHPRTALQNAEKHFLLTEVEKDIILKHMWPFTVVLPKCRESLVVQHYDKVCTFREFMKIPIL